MLLCWSVLFMTLHLLELVPTKGKLVGEEWEGRLAKLPVDLLLVWPLTYQSELYSHSRSSLIPRLSCLNQEEQTQYKHIQISAFDVSASD